ncbi:MAG: hypothetical protein HKN47_14200 [Pirellulaceae bacterium]|nr:hypothetical protein [Pirellulaceae bacterium]
MSGYSAWRVDFYGGPLDGHRQFMTPGLEPFLGVITIPEGSNEPLHPIASGSFGVQRPSRHQVRAPLAVYELESRIHQQARYRYVNSCMVEVDDLKGSCVLAIRHLPTTSS